MSLQSKLSPAYQIRFLLLCTLLQLCSSLDLPVLTGTKAPVPFEEVSVHSNNKKISIPTDCAPKAWETFPDLKNPAGKTTDFIMGCALRPWLAAVYENEIVGTDVTSGGLGDSSECNYLVMCKGDDDKMCDGEVGVQAPADSSGDDGAGKNILSPVDMHCDYGIKHEIQADQRYKIAHRWTNYEKGIRKYQKFIENNANDPERKDVYVRVPVTFPGDIEPNQMEANILAHSLYGVKSGQMFEGRSWMTTKCGAGCHYGQYVTLSYKPMDQPLIDIFVKDTCNWISVCTGFLLGDLQAPCSSKKMIHIMIKNGFVVFMGSRRSQTPLLLNRKGQYHSPPVHIQISRTVDELTRYNDLDGSQKKTARSIWSVTSMYRERAVGETMAAENQLLLMFDQKDCLYEGFGVRAKAEISVLVPGDDDALKDEIKAKNANLAEYDGQIEEQAAKQAVTENIVVSTEPTVGNWAAAETTTQSHQANISLMPVEVAIVNVASRQEILKAERAQESGHLLWGIFYGWLAGSFLAVLSTIPLFYFCRRTIFASWYRGMYKRYQCDASGTTGGLTGAAFGATGAETTGMQTVGETSGMSQISQMSQMETSGQSGTSQMSQASVVSQVSIKDSEISTVGK